jgi:glutathione S-transferase
MPAFDFIATDLGDKAHLMGDAYSVADGYLYNLLRWTARFGIDLARWPKVQAYFERIDARPTVKAALEAESARP